MHGRRSHGGSDGERRRKLIDRCNGSPLVFLGFDCQRSTIMSMCCGTQEKKRARKKRLRVNRNRSKH